MTDTFVPLGERSAAEIAQKLREIGDDEAAASYEALAKPTLRGGKGLESLLSPPRAYLNIQHQFGFIPRFEPGSGRYHPIVAASNAPATMEMKNKRINIKLEYLHVHEYPRPFLNLGDNFHTVLFTFEALNQLPDGSEPVAFNQTYRARSGQDVAVTGYPIFIGLNVGSDGVVLNCETVNVGNSNDIALVEAINSNAATAGLSLLTTAQPALAPLIGVAKGLSAVLAERSKNAPVQKFKLGLDFEEGALGARLAIGSYVAVQVERANELAWSDWSFDSETGTIVRTNLADGEVPYTLPYNAIVFRVSPYEGANA